MIDERVAASFARQDAMRLIGARLVTAGAGEASIELPFSPLVTQQHGFVHAGILTTAMDSACGYAALTVMPDEAAVMTVEFKVSLLRPAAGAMFRCTGTVLKAGRTLVFTEGRATAVSDDGSEQLVATISATMAVLVGREGFEG